VVDVRLMEQSEYVESLTLRGRDTENTLTANCIFLPQRWTSYGTRILQKVCTFHAKSPDYQHVTDRELATGTLPSICLAAGLTLHPLRLFLALRVGQPALIIVAQATVQNLLRGPLREFWHIAESIDDHNPLRLLESSERLRTVFY